MYNLTDILTQIPNREKKTTNGRTAGLTFCADPGISFHQFESILANHHHLIDAVVFSSATTAIDSTLSKKIMLCRHNNIEPMFESIVFEACLIRNQLDEYKKLCNNHGVTTHIVGESCINIPHSEKCREIEDLSKNGKVISMVGSKNSTNIIPPYKWIELMKAELESGALYVIANGGESGNTGIYRSSTEVREGLVQEILTQIPQEKIIWKAPLKNQQVYFIELCGTDCNLGQINLTDIISLEARRIGLSPEMFDFFLD
jgi:phosphosulfolactate synthase